MKKANPKVVSDAPKVPDNAALIAALELSDVEFNSKLASAVTVTTKAQDDVQALGLAAIIHCSQTKSADRINALIKSLPESLNRNSLREWVNLFAQVKWDNGSKQFSYDKTAKPNLYGATQKPWFKAKPEMPYQGFDMIQQLEKLYNRAQKKLENAKEGDKVTTVQLNRFGELINSLRAA